MAFIFNPASDPRRAQMAEYKTGAKVMYRDMAMPAEILSGPHKTTGQRQRYLIRKADGNVSLVPDTDLRRIVPRIDQVAGTLAMLLFGRSYASLDLPRQVSIAQAANRVLHIADSTRGQE